ncbi:MAG: patatin-like phospholipase family protein [Bacteroidota bacterium]
MCRTILFVCCLLTAITASSQKVGLVLSGGGAKGIAHVGVLKALEENNIPIDYVAGTSMGGIVAGCYAAGMSPQQIEEIMLSKEFIGWVSGRLEQGYNYYYNRPDDNPSVLKINLSLDSTFNFNLNSSIANDLSLNFALAEVMAQPAAIAKGNFDSLFVPLRVVAADIFTQTEVILKSGSLSDALRATQTVPFFYSPIKVDNKYLFDGGVYNNFPVDVMQNEFKPDVIIGSNVSSKVYDEYPYGEDEKLISKSLLYMLLDKSDPSKIPATGIYIQPNLKGLSGFDFARAKHLIDSGYAQTIRQIDEIKQKVGASAFRTCETVAEARNLFNNKSLPLQIDHISYQGFNSRQQRYMNRFFRNGRRPLYFSNVKEGYFKLVSDDYFHNVYPSFLFDNKTNKFNFHLAKRPQNDFQIDFGGVISTRNISTMFLGLNYYYFHRTLTHVTANFYAGNFYKAAQLKARIDFPNLGRFNLEPEATFNNWDFFEGKDIVLQNFSPTILNRIDRKVGVSVGVPVGTRFKASIYGYYINNLDRYVDTDVFVSTDTLDQLKLAGSRAGFLLSTNTLNRKQYPSQGKRYQFMFDWFSLTETLTPGNTSSLNGQESQHRGWVRGKVSMEQYFKQGFYSSGYLVEGVISNQPFFANYQGTIINASAFNPLQDSPTLLLPNFRAFNYVAGGWRNVFQIRKNLDFRLEGYVFKPFERIVAQADQSPALSQDLVKFYFAGTAGFVLHSSVGPISLSTNYYNDRQHQFGALLHVGFLLFQKPSLN